MFRFNFFPPEENIKDKDDVPEQSVNETTSLNEKDANSHSSTCVCKYVDIDESSIAQHRKGEFKEVVILESLALTRIVEGKLEHDAASQSLVCHAASSSDLVPRVYEGGFKVWECAIDLCEFVHTHLESSTLGDVLEIGCGHALPAITALKQGARSITVQDYNEEVMKMVCIPNALQWANSELEKLSETNGTNIELVKRMCTFVCGDWFDVNSLLGERKFDVMLTAETIYSEENYASLLRLIHTHLQKPSGVCYVAAKSFYFGVGGGVVLFQEYVHKHFADLRVTQERVIRDGKSNIREILSVRWTSG